jgi:hypothetical protein
VGFMDRKLRKVRWLESGKMFGYGMCDMCKEGLHEMGAFSFLQFFCGGRRDL